MIDLFSFTDDDTYKTSTLYNWKLCDNHWECFLQLWDICSMVWAFEVTTGDAAHLAWLVEAYLEEFFTLYDVPMIPRLHYLVHLPQQILQ